MLKGRKNKQIEIERNIRPYRHAIIRVIAPNGEPVSYAYIENEFNDGLVTHIEGGSGTYLLDINNASFKNLDNVVQETDIVHTEQPNIIVTSTFSTNLYERIQIDVFDPLSFVNVDIKGEILLTIREFYE